MKIAFYNIYKELNENNFMFVNDNTTIGDNLLSPMKCLKSYGESLALEIATVGTISVKEADIIVFIDMPKKNDPVLLDSIKSGKPMYLLILESPQIHPTSYINDNHNLFLKVFTWHDDLILSNKSKYIKINYSYKKPNNINLTLTGKSEFCCMIAGNKKMSHVGELYSERLQAIQWFESNNLESFDLYGTGWNEIARGENKYINYILRKNKKLNQFFSKKYKSFKGAVERKKPILEKYKFSICYENVGGMNGYITEKIFDCFFSGCVPIYLGASNVEKYIPKNCFIDKRSFNTYADLYLYMKSMSDDEYKNYLNNIEGFIKSPQFSQFTIEEFSQTIIDGIINEK